MTPERWQSTRAYMDAVFGGTDGSHAGVMERATAAGMPSIDAGPATGKLLMLLATVTRTEMAIEVGTLAGYSAIWIARGMMPGGRLITVEASAKHAAFAQKELDSAGVSERVHIRQGKGGEVLPAILRERGPGKTDLIFLDAERSEYLPLLPTIEQLLRPGGILAIDNALSAQRWVPDAYGPNEQPDVMDTVNRTIAGHKAFVSLVLPVGNGVLVATKR